MIDIYLDDDFNILLSDDEYFEFESFIPDDDSEIFIDGYYGQTIHLTYRKGEEFEE